MPSSYTPVYVHFVWSTQHRKPLIAAAWEARLYAAIAAKLRALNCVGFEINGMPDHVLVLLRMPVNRTIEELAQGMKGSTSHLINREIVPGGGFHWQGSYAAISVDPARARDVRSYVRNQKQHHAAATVVGEWERVAE